MSINKVFLVGYVGVEPIIRYVDRGIAVANVRLSTTIASYTKDDGTHIDEQTEWHNIVLWRKLAEAVEKYVQKGDKLYIEGSLRSSSYTDKKGETHHKTEVWAERMELMSQCAINRKATETANVSPTH